jgi:hypothetical protein
MALVCEMKIAHQAQSSIPAGVRNQNRTPGKTLKDVTMASSTEAIARSKRFPARTLFDT